jgi:hypothetical protein
LFVYFSEVRICLQSDQVVYIGRDDKRRLPVLDESLYLVEGFMECDIVNVNSQQVDFISRWNGQISLMGVGQTASAYTAKVSCAVFSHEKSRDLS